MYSVTVQLNETDSNGFENVITLIINFEVEKIEEIESIMNIFNNNCTIPKVEYLEYVIRFE